MKLNRSILLLLALFLYSTVALKNGFKPNMIGRAIMKSTSLIIASSIALSSLSINLPPALAFGPIQLTVDIKGYKQVELCNGQKPLMPGRDTWYHHTFFLDLVGCILWAR